jgi:molybdopterin converting factor small subunit
MSVLIHLPTPLRPYADNLPTIEVDNATTVGAALGELTERFPKLGTHLRDDAGKLRSFVNIFLGEENIRFLEQENTPVVQGSELSIIPSIAGGSQ